MNNTDSELRPAQGEMPPWTTIIRSRSGLFHLDLRELWRYRDLIMLFVRRDFIAQYKQTILGPLWFLLQPLFTTVVYTLVFGRIARIPTDGVPDVLFYLAGTVCWGYFANCLTETSNTFISNADIFGKVYFPRLVIPISLVISNMLKFTVQISLFLGFLAYFVFRGIHLSIGLSVFNVPLLVLQMAVLGLACGILVSSLTTKYRDLTMVVGFGVQLWMFATPVVYPLSQIPPSYRLYFALNPMTPVVESFRTIFLGTPRIGAEFIALGWATTLSLLFVGLLLFTRIEKTFMDTI